MTKRIFITGIVQGVGFRPCCKKVADDMLLSGTVKNLGGDAEIVIKCDNRVSEEFLRHVFEPFEREHTSTVNGIPGTGLGLTLVKSIIQLHGGQCFVRNTSTRYETKTETGVEFGFTIPLQ